MLHFTKSKEPSLLKELRDTTPGVGYTGVPVAVRDAVREQLAVDQGHLCAYCQRQITADGTTTHIEHWLPQSEYGGFDLCWANLLVTCKGVTGTEKHCDTAKANQILFLHPAAGFGHDPRDHLSCLENGKIQGLTPQGIRDVNTLRLNSPTLQRLRARRIQELLQDFQRYSGAEATWLDFELRRCVVSPGQRASEFAEFVHSVIADW